MRARKFRIFESIESMKRLIQLGILPKPNKSWEIVVPALQNLYPDRVSSSYTNGVEIRFPEHGLMFAVQRETVARYSLTCYDIDTEPVVIQEEDWGLPKQYLVADPYGLPDMWAVAEAIIAKVQDWIQTTIDRELEDAQSLDESSNFDRLLSLGMINVDNMSAWQITVARLRHRFPQFEIAADRFGTNLRVYNPNRDPDEGPEVYFEADWNRYQYPGTSTMLITLMRTGQWQPIRSFSQPFEFDTQLRNKAEKRADPILVSQKFADLIGGYIDAWFVKR